MTTRKPKPRSAQEWNEAWKDLQKTRRALDGVTFWDERAKSFAVHESPDEYVSSFIRLAQLQEQETVLDMGCGSGALSIPLGKQGHFVYACDFSKEMLVSLEANLRAFGVRTVTPLQLSWEDDWELHGLSENSVDIALASRSMLTYDLQQSLLKLHHVARRRVCVTLVAEGSPRIDQRAMEAIGLKNDQGKDHEFAMNILKGAGIDPELHFIKSRKNDSFDNEAAAFKVYKRMIDDLCPFYSEYEKAMFYTKIHEWLHDHLIVQEVSVTSNGANSMGEMRLRLDTSRENTWAFIAWNKR